MKRKRTHLLLTLVVLALVTVAQAVPTMDPPPPMYDTPPEWVGAERTTFNGWDFTTLQGDPMPEVGDGSGIMLDELIEGNLFTELDGLLGVAEDPLFMLFGIQNFPEPLPEKRMWVQLNWASFVPFLNPEVFIHMDSIGNPNNPNNVPNVGEHLWTEQIGFGSETGLEWYHSVFEIVHEPNPEIEDLLIHFNGPILIDSILVNTICQVPEPATILLLSLGGLLLRKRK